MIVVKNLSSQKTDRQSKNLIRVLKKSSFKIKIKTNLIKAEFLDVTFSLTKGIFRLYKTPNNNLSYKHVSSNHPPNIIKRLPNSINDLLSRNSSSKEVIDNTKKDYQKLLNKSDYKLKLLHKENSNNNNNSKEKNLIL